MGNGLPLFFILPCNNAGLFDVFDSEGTGKPNAGSCFSLFMSLGNNRTISALRLKHRSGSCGTASALPKCSIMSGCGTRIVLRGPKPLALCDRCPCFGSLFPPLAALTFAASSIICAFGLASAAPRSPYRHLELCGIALTQNPAAFAEIDDIFDVSDPPWENAKGVCLKKFSKALPQKAFITKGI